MERKQDDINLLYDFGGSMVLSVFSPEIEFASDLHQEIVWGVMALPIPTGCCSFT
jgi:hypothetical protein